MQASVSAAPRHKSPERTHTHTHVDGAKRARKPRGVEGMLTCPMLTYADLC